MSNFRPPFCAPLAVPCGRSIRRLSFTAFELGLFRCKTLLDRWATGWFSFHIGTR